MFGLCMDELSGLVVSAGSHSEVNVWAHDGTGHKGAVDVGSPVHKIIPDRRMGLVGRGSDGGPAADVMQLSCVTTPTL